MTELPDVREWLQRSSGLSAAQIVDALQHDQLQRWQRGERVPAEAYLQLLAGRSHLEGEQALDLVYGEYLLRDQRGESPSLAEYQWRFPQYTEQLRLLVDLDESFTLEVRIGDRTAEPTQSLANGQTAKVSPPSEAPTVPGYTILQEVGRGGVGVVYRALQHGLNRTVALKVIRSPDAESRARFRIEVEAVAGLQHANIVQIHEVGEASDDRGGCPYMALEFVEGGSLATRIRHSPLPVRETAALVETVARAVHYAHQHGILHRDLKPGNILLAETGRSVRTPKVADFGLAKRLEDLDSDHTRTGSIIGTPSYMAPEQAEGRTRDVGVATDVYALGIILYELLVGQSPFKGQTPLETLEAVRTREPVPPRRVQAKVPRDLETICLKAIRKEPGGRYPNAEALADDLRRYLHGEPILARRVGWPTRVLKWCRRYPALTATLLIAVLTVTTIAATGYLRVVRERDRYREEHNQAVANLYQSLVGEARAIRLARSPGYRAEALSRLQQALALDTPARDKLALRNEAIACLGDFVGLEPTVWSDMPSNDYVVALAVSPDGEEVALGMTQKTVRIRSRRTGVELARLEGHPSGIFAIRYGSTGNLLCTADDQGTVKIWLRVAGGWKNTRTLSMAPSGRPGYVHAVSLSITPDERRLFACSRSAKEVLVWDIQSGKEVERFRTPAGEPIYRCELSRDGKWLAAGLDPTIGSGIVVWETASHKIVHRFSADLGPINDIVFSASGKHLACVGEGGVALFDAPDFRSRLYVRGDAPNAVAFSPDERLLAIPALEFGLVRLWNIQANREVAVLKHPNEPHSIAFTSDGAALIGVGASRIHIWNLLGTGEKRVVRAHDGAVSRVCFGKDGSALFSCGGDRTIRIADPHTGHVIGQMHNLDGLDISADGKTLLTFDFFNTIKTWDVSDPAKPRFLHAYHSTLGPNVWWMAISPDGENLALGGDLGLILWRRNESRGVRLTPEKVTSFAFTPDGRRLAWLLGGGRFLVQDLVTEVQKTVHVEDSDLLHFPFFPDNRRFVQLSKQSDIAILDSESGERLSTLGRLSFGGQSDFYMGRSASLSADGAWLALQAPSIPVWDIEGKQMLFALPPSQTVPMCLAWGANREMLAVGSRDGEIVVWNIPILREQLRQIGLDW